MPGRTYVHPSGGNQTSAYFCIPLEQSLISRSPVLATLLENTGDVELPAEISTDEFLEWAKAPVESAASMPAKQICVALQVLPDAPFCGQWPSNCIEVYRCSDRRQNV